MQPDVVPVQREHAKERVQSGNQAHYREDGEEDSDRRRVNSRPHHAAPSEDAPSADGEMDGAMQQIHREEAQQITVQQGEMSWRRIGRRRHERARMQAEESGAEISDT